mmetsp:Transcript_56986/g.124623  ORF Transcript_56986/g.124623 Transcript_56986/m.124623 type:complete len:200 (+) Transcript_56986:359-958(+)
MAGPFGHCRIEATSHLYVGQVPVLYHFVGTSHVLGWHHDHHCRLQGMPETTWCNRHQFHLLLCHHPGVGICIGKSHWSGWSGSGRSGTGWIHQRRTSVKPLHFDRWWGRSSERADDNVHHPGMHFHDTLDLPLGTGCSGSRRCRRYRLVHLPSGAVPHLFGCGAQHPGAQALQGCVSLHSSGRSDLHCSSRGRVRGQMC